MPADQVKTSQEPYDKTDIPTLGTAPLVVFCLRVSAPVYEPGDAPDIYNRANNEDTNNYELVIMTNNFTSQT
jgi:hypothetical protein